MFDDDNEESALKEPKRKVKYSSVVCYSCSNHWEFFASCLFNAILFLLVCCFSISVVCFVLTSCYLKEGNQLFRE